MSAPDPLAALLAEHREDGSCPDTCLCENEVPDYLDGHYAAHLAAVLRDAGYEHGPTARAEALGEARDDIKARIVTFRGLDAHPEYMNALNDAWGLVANRERAARLREHDGGTQ